MKILIVEDEVKVASFLQTGLEELGYECLLARDGEQALSIAAASPPDIAILDIIIPKINGIEVCRTLRGNDRNLRIIMLTAMGGLDEKLRCFGCGADDYLVKPFEFLELVARIRTMEKRLAEEGHNANLLCAGDLCVNLDSKEVLRGETRISLTAKEFALLEFLLRNKDKVVSRSQIAESVWDINFDTGTNIIDVYVNFLRKKIDRNFEPKLIHTLIGMGYMLKDSP
jgi:two-component system, OmpR family, copper resistance phosphate regulon response regulator CusR